VTTPTDTAAPGLDVLTRPSGGLAMLALDHREALWAMLAEHTDSPVDDAAVTDFKLMATRELTPYASAVLLDKQFVLDRALAERAVDPGCALVAAADEFIPGRAPGEFVGDVRIDAAVDPAHYAAQGARALKLLVLWRSDEPAEARVAMVDDFVARCRAARLLAIIEPVCRPPRDGSGFDLYKGEVPLHGKADAVQLREACRPIDDVVASPWVVLSSGVDADDFPAAVSAAVLAGASGFLAGRAVWKNCIGAADLDHAIRTDAVPRLQRLALAVDDALEQR
jgi:sulfofructosephosphate aldolase